MPTLRAAQAADLPLLVQHRRRMWEDMGHLTPGALHASDAGRPLNTKLGFVPSSEMWLDVGGKP